MSPITLSGLHVYPIKSAGGFAVGCWPVDEFGLQHDRRWVVVDERGEAITQREHPRLALVRTAIVGEMLQVTAPGQPGLALPLHPAATACRTATVWGDACESWWLGDQPARWFSDLLGRRCSLVYMPAATWRPADPDCAPPGVRVSFADAFPFLLLSEESLADLRARLAEPVPMSRFRPNLVIAGGHAYFEDRLTTFRIGELDFMAVKPCARCVLTTTDQDTGERGAEPLRTLATYRRLGGEVLFGQNVVHRATGQLAVGQAVQV